MIGCDATVANVAKGGFGNSATLGSSERNPHDLNSLRDTCVAKGGLATTVLLAGKWLKYRDYQLPLPLRRENPLPGEGYSPRLTAIAARSQNDKCSHGGRAPSPIRTLRSPPVARRRTLAGKASLAEIHRVSWHRPHPVAGGWGRRGRERAAPATATAIGHEPVEQQEALPCHARLTSATRPPPAVMATLASFFGGNRPSAPACSRGRARPMSVSAIKKLDGLVADQLSARGPQSPLLEDGTPSATRLNPGVNTWIRTRAIENLRQSGN